MIGGYQVLYDDRDLDQATNEAILAVDGRLAREDARLIAKAVLKAVGLDYKRPKAIAAPAPAPADDLPEVRG